jgi:hypothetical protein
MSRWATTNSGLGPQKQTGITATRKSKTAGATTIADGQWFSSRALTVRSQMMTEVTNGRSGVAGNSYTYK